jgi:hypothetical protein
MTSRALIVVLLLLASTSVAAREVRLAGPNGGGGGNAQQCQDLANATPDATTKAPAKPRPAVAVVQPRKPAKVMPAARAESDADSDGPRLPTPRWHSFLPGMFR